MALKRFVLIQADHPIVSAIQENSERLQLGDVAAMTEGLIKVSSALFEALLPMVQAQVSSQIRVRDFENASVSIAPAEFSSWAAARESIVSERMEGPRREHAAAMAAAASDQIVAELESSLKDQQAAIEADVDHEKHEIHLEIDVAYQFLSNGAASTPDAP